MMLARKNHQYSDLLARPSNLANRWSATSFQASTGGLLISSPGDATPACYRCTDGTEPVRRERGCRYFDSTVTPGVTAEASSPIGSASIPNAQRKNPVDA